MGGGNDHGRGGSMDQGDDAERSGRAHAGVGHLRPWIGPLPRAGHRAATGICRACRFALQLSFSVVLWGWRLLWSGAWEGVPARYTGAPKLTDVFYIDRL